MGNLFIKYKRCNMLGPDRILAAANYDFEGKRFLITGASGGIALAAIKKLLESGAIVYSNSRRPLDIKHENLFHSEGDITDDDFVKGWVTSIENIDGLVYSAGMIDPRPIRFDRKDERAAGSRCCTVSCRPRETVVARLPTHRSET